MTFAVARKIPPPHFLSTAPTERPPSPAASRRPARLPTSLDHPSVVRKAAPASSGESPGYKLKRGTHRRSRVTRAFPDDDTAPDEINTALSGRDLNPFENGQGGGD